MKKNKTFLKWLASKPNGLALLATTTDEFEYYEYVESCQMNGQTPQGEDSEDFHRWCDDMAAENYQSDISNLKASPFIQRPFVVTGTVGRWNGSFPVTTRFFEEFDEAFASVTGGDTVDVEVRYCTQYIAVAGHHHDATNHFQLWPVKTHTDMDALKRRIDDGKFDPYCLYDRRFLQPIKDYII